MKRIAQICVSAGTVMLLMPAMLFAQSSAEELRAAIQMSMMDDPRVQEIPPEQLKGLIDQLVAEAQAAHMSSSDILWQPQKAAAASAMSEQRTACPAGWEGYLCKFEEVFGFTGSSYEIPILILVTAGILLVVIWELIAHHRKKMAEKASKPPQFYGVVR
jgi:hypothetical protein